MDYESILNKEEIMPDYNNLDGWDIGVLLQIKPQPKTMPYSVQPHSHLVAPCTSVLLQRSSVSDT